MSHWQTLNQSTAGCDQVLRAAMFVVQAWDTDVAAHGERTAQELVPLAPAECAVEWYWAGLLHDLGKIMLPPSLLHKCSRLNARERKAMQAHPAKGAAILIALCAPPAVVHGAKFHHERWDGNGYPLQLREYQIPRVARVLAVADAYAALTSDRPYRRALAAELARREIERHAGTQFDPEIVIQFFEERRHEPK